MDKERGGDCLSVVQRLTEKFVNNKLFHEVVSKQIAPLGARGESGGDLAGWGCRGFFVGFACVAVFRPERVLQYGQLWDLIIRDGALF